MLFSSFSCQFILGRSRGVFGLKSCYNAYLYLFVILVNGFSDWLNIFFKIRLVDCVGCNQPNLDLFYLFFCLLFLGHCCLGVML